MEYGALAVCAGDELLLYLRNRFNPHVLHFESVSTVQEASRKLYEKPFHLLIVDLEYVRSIGQSTWLENIRRISYVPLIVLSNTPEQDSSSMVELGADICISGRKAISVLGDIVFAQFRRYTEYNHRNDPRSVETSSFQSGDFFIDPARRIVEVCGQPVNLRPREFSLLLYFMRNPNIVLTTEQICEQAWGMGGSYNRGISQPIRILRLAIEPNPNEPVYIETVRLVGYRFTAYSVKTCDNC